MLLGANVWRPRCWQRRRAKTCHAPTSLMWRRVAATTNPRWRSVPARTSGLSPLTTTCSRRIGRSRPTRNCCGKQAAMSVPRCRWQAVCLPCVMASRRAAMAWSCRCSVAMSSRSPRQWRSRTMPSMRACCWASATRLCRACSWAPQRLRTCPCCSSRPAPWPAACRTRRRRKYAVALPKARQRATNCCHRNSAPTMMWAPARFTARPTPTRWCWNSSACTCRARRSCSRLCRCVMRSPSRRWNMWQRRLRVRPLNVAPWRVHSMHAAW